MKIDVYSATGTKTGSMELPASMFGVPVKNGLIHQAVIMQQSNRRNPIAHVKSRGEVQGSTKKLYAQKHTGRARRGSVRSPLLRGGGKAFGPRNVANFTKNMPKSMRHAALFACLSLQAKKGVIMGLESYPDTVKTKDLVVLIKKLPIDFGRRVLLVLPERHNGLHLSARNVPSVKTVLASYLNPEDVVNSRYIILLKGAVEKAEETFGKKDGTKLTKKKAPIAAEPKKKVVKTTKKTTKKAAPKKTAAKKETKKSASTKA